MTFSYQGSELDLFQHAVNWKRYYAGRLQPYITGDVLEVGAGIGATSRFLCRRPAAVVDVPRAGSGACDAAESGARTRTAASAVNGSAGHPRRSRHPRRVSIRFSTSTSWSTSNTTARNCDKARDACVRTDESSCWRPAHGWLFSRFDRAIGHHRRYSAAMLARITPPPLHLAARSTWTASGCSHRFANRLLLREAYPTRAQIRFWDSTLIRLSRLLDPCGRHRIGKTVIGIFSTTAEGLG